MGERLQAGQKHLLSTTVVLKVCFADAKGSLPVSRDPSIHSVMDTLKFTCFLK
jgi:hypothetical protein